MNYLKKIALCIFTLSTLIVMIFLYVEIKTNRALKDYSMLPDEQTVVDKAVLGRGSTRILVRLRNGLKRGALELICTNKGNIYLLMKDDVRYLTFDKGATLFTDFRVENGVKKGEAEIEEMDQVSSGYFDTMLSRPLSEKETSEIIQALKEQINSKTISLGLDDGSYGFIDRANISDVIELIEQCNKIKNGLS